MTQFEEDITLEQAQEAVIQTARRLETERIPLSEALGRMLGQNVVAARDFPVSDTSRVDGYCFSAATTARATPEAPVTLRVKATIRAGVAPDFRLERDECAQIMTGALLPDGADAVIKVEEAVVGEGGVKLDAGRVAIVEPVASGLHVVRAGDVAEKGERVLERGGPIRGATMGLIAALAGAEVSVSKRPRVGIVATGDEIVPADGRVNGALRTNSNSYMLRGLLEAVGCDVFDAGIAGDTVGDIVRHLEKCTECDALITTGGVSGSEYDRMPDALLKLGAGIIFRGILMRPGRRMIYARGGAKPGHTLRDRVLFCLPGNPVASLVLFHLIVKPGLLAAMGSANPVPARVRAELTEPVRGVEELRSPAAPGSSVPGRTSVPVRPPVSGGTSAPVMTLVPARLLGGSGVPGPGSSKPSNLRVEPLRSCASGDIVRLARADCLISLTQDDDGARPGEEVDIFPLEEAFNL